MGQLPHMLYSASIWAIPVVIAVTFHEAAHGFVARFLGDDTAWKLGRVSLNPIKHIDPVGTILLPGSTAAGLAVPVRLCQAGASQFSRAPKSAQRYGLGSCGRPCHEHRARHFGRARLPPRRVPARNRGAMGCGKLEERADHQCRIGRLQYVSDPPLDGGRIAVGVLPNVLASPLARLEPYGMLILIGLLFILPMWVRNWGSISTSSRT